MKEVNIDGGVPSYNDSPVSTLNMSQGKHIRFTAMDQAYIVEAFSEADGALSSDLPLSVPNDDAYHTLEIQGTKGNSYGLTIAPDSEGGAGGGTDEVKPTMIVKVE
jgi:hypothetical protein